MNMHMTMHTQAHREDGYVRCPPAARERFKGALELLRVKTGVEVFKDALELPRAKNAVEEFKDALELPSANKLVAFGAVRQLTLCEASGKWFCNATNTHTLALI